MAILAGNLASRISLRLQFHALSIPWVQKNPMMVSLNGRDCSSSSGPVRYIPKRTSKKNDVKNLLPTTGSESRVFDSERLDDVERGFVSEKKKKETKRSPNTSRAPNEGVMLDDAQQCNPELAKDINQNFGVNDIELMKDPRMIYEGIRIQLQHDNSKHDMQVDKVAEEAERFAIKLLATRAFTAVELRKKLQGKRFAPATVDAVITSFQDRGLINDGLYAETFSRSRWSSSSWGPRRIKQEWSLVESCYYAKVWKFFAPTLLWIQENVALLNRGVNKADTENALKLVFQDGKSEEQESKLGLSKLSMDHLLIQASKQWLRGQDVPKETRKSRLIRWLQYRGFNWDIISFVLKKMESQNPSRAQ
ncbi:hypothetical protein Tsubulata_016411 [Turnera subulata]|uniref:Regulatory protein RecX n=1 Tax=Turnera subulata TaxID=218843 RepID=A0A9Q0FKY0_9ROSI|nr:hypothetical protein Tsubulata_016411 [Turnera subulata]